jgi:hypothetical protein
MTKEPTVVVKPWFKVPMSALWIVCLGSLSFILYGKYQFVASCQAQLGQMQLAETQNAQTEAQLDAVEATLDAAEAQLDKARR